MRKALTDNLMKMNKFFNLPVEVTEHKTLNSSKGIINDRILKDESEENIKEYLENQGVTNVKRFKVKKGHDLVNTNTLLLTFNTVVPPKSLRIFYQIIPVDVYVSNPLRCFNCQKFGHHEDKCPSDRFVKDMERETMIIIRTTVKIQQNVLTVVAITYQGRMNAQHGKRKMKS